MSNFLHSKKSSRLFSRFNYMIYHNRQAMSTYAKLKRVFILSQKKDVNMTRYFIHRTLIKKIHKNTKNVSANYSMNILNLRQRLIMQYLHLLVLSVCLKFTGADENKMSLCFIHAFNENVFFFLSAIFLFCS